MSEVEEALSSPIWSSSLLQVHEETRDSAVILHVAGDIDLNTAGLLAEKLEQAEQAIVPPAPVVVDLSGVEFLGSAGLMVLAKQSERCAHLGLPLRIVGSSHAVLRSIEVAGLDTVLRVLPTIDEALAA